jgi:two-component system phosphate regulon response regulator PhoB
MSLRLTLIIPSQSMRETLATDTKKDGWTVTVKTSVAQVIKTLKEDPPNLVLIDCNEVGTAEKRLMRACRESPQAENVLVVVCLPALAQEDQTIQAFDVGVDEVLHHPISVDEIRARLRAFARRMGGGLRGDFWETANVRMFDEGHRLECGNSSMNLTDSEFRILKVLLQRAGRTIARKALFGYLWGEASADLHSRTLDVHISRLRKKVVEFPIEIETVRPAGYRAKLTSASS